MTALRASHARAEIVLDDLENPRFSSEVNKVFAARAAASVPPLEPEALREAATARVGLSDFGAPDFSEPFHILCQSLRDEANLSPVGNVMATGHILGHLCYRLRIEELIKRHPEIRSIPIERPIIITGMPRSGTTHLVNILAADPELRCLPYWEVREPLPAVGEPSGEAGVRARIERSSAGLKFMRSTTPHFDALHELTAEGSLDEVELLGQIFSSYMFDNKWTVPQYREWYSGTDQRPAYAHLKLLLQVLQWLRPGKRWLLKSVGHIEQLGPLIETFPDATVIVSHRDPLKVTVSLATMLTYQQRLHVAHPNPIEIGTYWAARIEAHAAAAVRDRALLPSAQSTDILMSEFMADEWGTIARIYNLAGQPLSERSQAAMQHHLYTHPRGRCGFVRYDFATVGLKNQRSAVLRDYSERFHIPDDSW